LEGLPVFVGYVTLAAGAALAAAPGRVTGPLGLDGQDMAVRAIGLLDLVLVPGLLRGSPRWPWMVGRTALNVATAAYLHGGAAVLIAGSAERSSSSALGPHRGGRVAGLALRRAES